MYLRKWSRSEVYALRESESFFGHVAGSGGPYSKKSCRQARVIIHPYTPRLCRTFQHIDLKPSSQGFGLLGSFSKLLRSSGRDESFERIAHFFLFGRQHCTISLYGHGTQLTDSLPRISLFTVASGSFQSNGDFVDGVTSWPRLLFLATQGSAVAQGEHGPPQVLTL